MNKLQEKKFKAGYGFLIKNIKKLKFIYLIKKDEVDYINFFNESVANCKTKQEAQDFINEQYEIILEEVNAAKQHFEKDEDEDGTSDY